jgi:uncharacterized protein (TIGR03435 family)
MNQMNGNSRVEWCAGKMYLFTATALMALTLQTALAQSSVLTQGQSSMASSLPVVTGNTPEFEVASVRENKSDGSPSLNVDPTYSDGPVPTGGLYLARNIKLIQFIAFAYRLTTIQLRSLESAVPWTTEVRFDIDARAEGNPSKAQYRLMMRALLRDRFQLKIHYETRQTPIYALVLAKPGKFGPRLRLHQPDDPVCTIAQAAPPSGSGWSPTGADAEGFPLECGMTSMKPSVAGRMKDGGRDVSMSRFAAIITGVGQVDRPMVDQTGLDGNVDYTLEWKQVATNMGIGATSEPDDSAPTFEEALRQQLGIKMVSQQGPVELFFVDHIEQPSPN